MEMNINLDLSIGEGEAKKDISLTYEEAKELYGKLGNLFKLDNPINISYPFLKEWEVWPGKYSPYTWCEITSYSR